MTSEEAWQELQRARARVAYAVGEEAMARLLFGVEHEETERKGSDMESVRAFDGSEEGGQGVSEPEQHIADVRHWMDVHQGLVAADGAAPTEVWPLDVAGLRESVEPLLEEIARLQKREARLETMEDALWSGDPAWEDTVFDMLRGRR